MSAAVRALVQAKIPSPHLASMLGALPDSPEHPAQVVDLYRALATPGKSRLEMLARAALLLQSAEGPAVASAFLKTEVPASELAAIAHRRGAACVYDLGSGLLVDLAPFGLAGEPTVQQAVASGADVVTFSGDKLLGGPQAGVVVGSAAAVAAVRRHPLARALRIDKLSLAALEATLELYRDPAAALANVPVLAMVAEDAEAVRDRADALAARLGGRTVASTARVGGGAVPLLELASFACALEGGDALAARLRAADPPVVARVQEGRVLLDCRTMTDEECRRIPRVP